MTFVYFSFNRGFPPAIHKIQHSLLLLTVLHHIRLPPFTVAETGQDFRRRTDDPPLFSLNHQPEYDRSIFAAAASAKEKISQGIKNLAAVVILITHTKLFYTKNYILSIGNKGKFMNF